MREVKFRGKSMHSDEWVFGSLVVTDNSTNNPLSGRLPQMIFQIMHFVSGDWNLGGWVSEDVYENSIGQFTGIIDLKGIPIFEGDIIECLYSTGRPCRHIVRYCSDKGGYCQYTFDNDEINEGCNTGLISQKYITEIGKYVIGNEYDNGI